MNIFQFRKRFFVFLILLLLGMVFLQWFNGKSREDPLSRGSFFIFSEIQTAGVNFRRGISELIQKYLFLLELRESNRNLESQNAELKARLQAFEEVFQENKRLKQLFQFFLNQPVQLLPAQVTGTDFLSKNKLLTINRGSSQGAKKFMGVLSPEGVVGYIFRTSPNSSQVISLLDPLSSLPARNRRSRISGLVSAYKDNLLIFDHLDGEFSENSPDLKVGDALVTIKSEQFPAGFLVGNILSVYHSPENFHSEAYIQPAVRFHSLEEVLIVLSSRKKAPSEKMLETP